MKAIWLALAIIAAPGVCAAQDGFDGIWTEYGPALSADGISRPMAHTAYLWTEGQYHLGLCRKYVPDADAAHWRGWWDDTPIVHSAIGRRIVEGGEEMYVDGLERAAAEPLDFDQCTRILNSWIADLDAAMAATD